MRLFVTEKVDRSQEVQGSNWSLQQVSVYQKHIDTLQSTLLSTDLVYLLSLREVPQWH